MADEKRKVTIGREEKKQLIGTKVAVGSIVRVKDGNRTIHIVITDIDREWYEGAKIILSAEPYDPDKEVLLVKGEDAVYQNSNYKVKVRVLAETITGLKYENFIQGAGGTIVGRVTNDDTLQKICKNVCHRKSEDDRNIDAVTKSEIKTEATISDTETAMEQHIEETERNTESFVIEAESGAGQGDDVKLAVPILDFEKVLSASKDVDELISNLGLFEYEMLEEAVRLAIDDRHGKIKKILVTMHANHPKLNQNAIRIIMNQELSEWVAAKNLQMIEFSVSYVLKAIAKGMR